MFFLFIFSNYLYKISIFKFGISEYLEKQQSNYSNGPAYRQRYNSTNNANSDNPWDYKNETYSDYLKRLTTSTNVSNDYIPNDFSNSKLSLYDANLLVYSDKYVRDEFPDQINDGVTNRSNWYNPITSSVHYGPDFEDSKKKIYGFEKWKDIFLPPKIEESLAVELSDPTYTNAKIIISSTNNSFENIKSVNIVNDTNKQSFNSDDIQTWRDDKSNIPSDLKVTPSIYRGSNSKTIFGFEWENASDSSYNGYYEFMGSHNPYDHGGYNGGHYLAKGPDRVNGYDINIDNENIYFNELNKEYSIPIKWNIRMNSYNDFVHVMSQINQLIFTKDNFPWVDSQNKWVDYRDVINSNSRSLILSSMFYGYGLDKNLSIIDNTNLLRTLSFFTSPGDIDTNPEHSGISTDGIYTTDKNQNFILTSHLDNKYFVGDTGLVDERYYKSAYTDKNGTDHYIKSPFIYNYHNYYTKLLPWVDAYTINDNGEYDLIDSQYVFDPNEVVWKISEMNEDDGPIVEVEFTMNIQNNSFLGMNNDNLILDIVNYAPYIHRNGGYYNKLIISSNIVVVSAKPTSAKYFFDYYLDHTNMNIMLMEDLKYRFKFKIFVPEREYPNLKDKEIEYYLNNDKSTTKTTNKKVDYFVQLGDTNTYVELEIELSSINVMNDIESIAFVIKDNPPASFPSFNPVVSFGTNLIMKDINLIRDADTKHLIITFTFDANSHIEEKFYYWGSELITKGSLTSSTRMVVDDSDNGSYKIKEGNNFVNVVIDESYISNIVNLKDNFIFGYSDSLDDHPTHEKTFKVYNEELQDIVIPKAGKSSNQKFIEEIIILTSVIAFFIISVFSSGIALFIRSNKQTRMVINSLDDEIFNADDMEEDFELSL